MANISWLVSYPKSGNTWMRIFLSNYLAAHDKPLDINNLLINDISSNRRLFDEIIGLSSSDMDAKSIRNYQPYVYLELSKIRKEDIFMKVHDGYTFNDDNSALFPSSVTKKVIYIIRNPLDVAISFAHHLNTSIDNIVSILNDEDYLLANSMDKLNNQLPQLLLSWSSHVKSWIESELDIHIVRYEDMIQNPVKEFRQVLEVLGIEVNESRLIKAIEFSSFENLREQEKKNGFFMKDPRTKTFFREGKIGSFRDVMTPREIKKVISHHKEVMLKYSYLDKDDNLIV